MGSSCGFKEILIFWLVKIMIIFKKFIVKQTSRINYLVKSTLTIDERYFA